MQEEQDHDILNIWASVFEGNKTQKQNSCGQHYLIKGVGESLPKDCAQSREEWPRETHKYSRRHHTRGSQDILTLRQLES